MGSIATQDLADKAATHNESANIATATGSRTDHSNGLMP